MLLFVCCNLRESITAGTELAHYGRLRRNSRSVVAPVDDTSELIVIHSLQGGLAGYEPQRKDTTYQEQQAVLGRPRFVSAGTRHGEELRKVAK